MAEKDPDYTAALDNILECQLCHNKLKAPLTLKQCLHSFCISCVETIPKKTMDGKEGRFCPKCNTFSGKDEIDTHFFVASLVDVNNNLSAHESTHKSVICEQCKGDSGVSGKCLDCKMALCEKCKSFHLNIPMLKGHKITRLAHDLSDVIDDLMFCPLHQERINELNCKPCAKVICMECKATEHQNHPTELIATTLYGIDTNTANVSENVQAMKAQLKCVKSKIQQTKHEYASCRLKMDYHLEKVISQLRAKKAKVADEVTDQEGVALNKLNGIKLKLENQLSKANNIINLVAAAKNCYRDVSLLTTMHEGLYEKVNTIGEKKQDDIDVQIPVVAFTESDNIESTFGEVFGDIKYKEESIVVDMSGQIIHLQHMCVSFEDLFTSMFIEDLTIDLLGSANRFSYIEDQIWVPLNNQNLICIYNMQGGLIKSVDTEKRVTVVKKAHNGDIIAGGYDGIYVVSKDWSEWSQISEGHFNDITLHGNRFWALDYYSQEILTFSYRTSNNKWTEIQNFTVTAENMQSNDQSTISSSGDAFVVSDVVGKKVLQYKKNGDFVKSKSLKFRFYFAGTDRSGQVLLTNFQKGTLHLLDVPSEELTLQNIGDIKIPQLRDVIIDGEKNLWCLRGSGNKFAVVKFVMKK